MTRLWAPGIARTLAIHFWVLPRQTRPCVVSFPSMPRERTIVGSTVTEFVYNAAGQRATIWNGNTKTVIQGQYYWGTKHVAYYLAGGAVNFQHQDWTGSEQIRTNSAGIAEETNIYLPFGDDLTTTGGTDTDAYHFAQIDHDYETDTEHAQFRQYSSAQGRFLSPDPYGGSYDPSNPQSFNRYAYVMNNPLSNVDPSGLMMLPPPIDLGEVCWEYGVCADSDSETGEGTSDGGGPGSGQPAPAPPAPAQPATNKPCGNSTLLPRSAGVGYGANLDFGFGAYGASANGSVGGSYFTGSNTAGAYASGGAAAYYLNHNVGLPAQTGQPVTIGANAGVSPIVWASNAQSAQQLFGQFTTISLNAGAGPAQGSLSLSYGGGIWQLSIGLPIPRLSAGTPSISFSKLTTFTLATQGCH